MISPLIENVIFILLFHRICTHTIYKDNPFPSMQWRTERQTPKPKTFLNHRYGQNCCFNA